MNKCSVCKKEKIIHLWKGTRKIYLCNQCYLEVNAGYVLYLMFDRKYKIAPTGQSASSYNEFAQWFFWHAQNLKRWKNGR